MTGQEYLEEIQAKLESGSRQHKMGENLLRAFGYVRRRATAIEEINLTLERLGLIADPSVDAQMPLRTPRIRFLLKNAEEPTTPETAGDSDTLDAEDNIVSLPEPAFSISELTSARTDVVCVSPSAPVQQAYTTMLIRKYSQLVVANQQKPRQQDVKGIVSFQSMAKALMNGKPTKVSDCIDKDVPVAHSDSDLKSVVSQLASSDVVLVYGRDNRLQGIITAWDLAEEFAELVDPFKRIGEIEQRLRTLISKRLGLDKVVKFLSDHELSGNDAIAGLEELTMGELQRVLEFPEHWDALKLAFDRTVFIAAFGEARSYRNRLMHFGDPLSEAEMMRLTNFCDMVREIEL